MCHSMISSSKVRCYSASLETATLVCVLDSCPRIASFTRPSLGQAHLFPWWWLGSLDLRVCTSSAYFIFVFFPYPSTMTSYFSFRESRSEALAFSFLPTAQRPWGEAVNQHSLRLVQTASPPGVPSGCGLDPAPHPVRLCLRAMPTGRCSLHHPFVLGLLCNSVCCR